MPFAFIFLVQTKWYVYQLIFTPFVWRVTFVQSNLLESVNVQFGPINIGVNKAVP